MCNHYFVFKSKKRYVDKKLRAVLYTENTWRCEKCGQEVTVRADYDFIDPEYVVVDEGPSP